MRLFIVQPTHYRSPTDRSLHKTRKRSVVNLTLPYLAALVPNGWDITLIDEQLEDIDFNAPIDAVAITTWTMNSIRAYDIADQFRERGIPVFMGGPHLSFHSEEAVEHCDAICIGEGDMLWPLMLEDALAGRLKKIYRSNELLDLEKLRMPRYELIDLKPYGFFKTFSIQSSRGCPFRCEFCSERLYLGEAYRYRPTQDVIDEIKHIRAKSILFADSNFAGNLSHTMELMEALIPLKIRWSALWSAHLCKNDAFMDLANKSGLLHLNIGMESIDSKTLISMNKKANKASEYQTILAGLRRRGISYSLNFIFGWDTETEDVFPATLEFLTENKVPAAYFNILAPDKGTPLYDRMMVENRITNVEEMGRWPGDRCYIKPRNYSPEVLEKKVRDLHNAFYSYPSMFARLPFPGTIRDIASWVINFSQHDVMRKDSKENFDSY